MTPSARRTPLRAGLLVALLLFGSALGFAGCASTLQQRPLPHNTLEGLLLAPFPVYWLGRSFQGKAISEAVHDPGGAFTVAYGDCIIGGQSTCVPAVRVVTSPDNSFVPGGAAGQQSLQLRGVTARSASGGKTIEIPTGGVVVDIYAVDPTLARAAAQTIAAINEVGAPGARLPARGAVTSFASTPLPAQLPSPLHPPS